MANTTFLLRSLSRGRSLRFEPQLREDAVYWNRWSKYLVCKIFPVENPDSRTVYYKT